MPGYYANITLHGPSQQEVVAFLTTSGESAYVAPAVKGNTVVFHEDVGRRSGWSTTCRRTSTAPPCW